MRGSEFNLKKVSFVHNRRCFLVSHICRDNQTIPQFPACFCVAKLIEYQLVNAVLGRGGGFMAPHLTISLSISFRRVNFLGTLSVIFQMKSTAIILYEVKIIYEIKTLQVE